MAQGRERHVKDLTGLYGVIQLPGPVPTAISVCTRSPFNHTFVMVSPTHLVEAWVPCARLRPLADYAHLRVLFNTGDGLTARQRGLVAEYARRQVGSPYDLLHFAGLTLEHLFGLPVATWWPVALYRTICSTLVARAGAHAGLDFTSGLPLANVTPATLAGRLSSAQRYEGVTMRRNPWKYEPCAS